ncbi:MAG TPA: PAS domain S-box protein, partial [Burkholderiales bacterium]|nr:PAS domain S-box protein [Burkholderiales bacterium]
MDSEGFVDRRYQWREPVAILLVEDDRQFAELVRAQLRRMPWVNSRLELAGSLAAALARMAAEPFGLVITDLNLPDSRGLDTLGALTAAGEQPVIVLTGDADPAMRAGALAAGAYDLLSKDGLSAAVLERLVRLATIQAGTYRLVHESVARFRSLIRLSSDFYWESDAEHRVAKIEHGADRHPAVDPLQIGKARWQLPSTHPDAEGWAAHRALLEARLPFRDFEVARRGSDGVERWRSISGEPMLDARGAFLGYRGVGRDITERKRAEEELRRFRVAMDESADMIVLIERATMRFIDVNRTACALLGYSREELLALGPQDVLPLGRGELELAYDELIADPARPSGMNSYYRCKDGSRLPFESTRRVLRSREGWIIAAISRDIRERIASERALRESEARFRSLSALSADWYWEQDAEFRLTYMSTIDRLGLDASRYLGVRRWERPALNLTEGDWARHRAQLERHEAFHDFEVQRPDGKGGSVWLSLSGEPVYDVAGRFTGYRGVGRDITGRKREEQLRRLEHAVTRCLAEAGGAASALQGVLRAICEAEQWDCGRYLAVDEAAGLLRLAHAWARPDSELEDYIARGSGVTWQPGAGISGRVWQTGEPFWVADIAEYRSAGRRVFGPESGMRGVFAFPVSAGGRTIGVLIFNAREVRAPVERLLQAARVIGSQVGQYVQRQRAEETWQRLSAMYVALGAANEAILRAASPQEVFERVCRIAVDAGGFQLGTVLLVERGARALKRVAESGVAAGRVEGPLPSLEEGGPGGRGLIGLACRSGEPAISNDYQADPRIAERGMRMRGYEIGSGAVFPLRVEGELAGVFCVQHGERNVFTGELTGLLQRLADNIAFALENFRGEARQRTAKRALSESEERFRRLTQLSADVYWEQDEQYRFTAFTDSARRRNEVEPAVLLGRRRWELDHVNMTPADWQRHIAQLDARQPFHDLELCRIVEGRRQWISASGEPVLDGAGRFKGYRGIVKDITERKRADELREFEHSVTRSLAEADGVEDALRGALRAVCLGEGWQCGRYFAVDERAAALRFAVGWGIEDEAVQRFVERSASLSFARGEGLVGRAWQDARPLWVADIHAEPRIAQAALAREAGIRSAFFLPVLAGGRAAGVLAFGSRQSREPDAAFLQAIQVVGSQVGQFIQRKQAEQEVRESEARFRSLTQLSNDWYWEQDAEFRFVKFEGRSGAPGYAPSAAVLGRRVWELPGIELGSADWDALQAAMHRHESFRNFTYSYRDASGRRFHVAADGEPVFDAGGRFAGFRGTSRDVTRQRLDEEELRRFRAAMDMSLDAIYLTDRGTLRFVDVNAAACRGVGYSREQLLSMGPEKLLHTPREVLEQEYDAVIARGERGMRSESSYAGGDGRTRWTELHRRALRSGDAWIIVTVSRDITERKAAEQRQAQHLRFQERVARFGQSALGRRRPADLIDEAVQNVLEGLDGDLVAYFERAGG